LKEKNNDDLFPSRLAKHKWCTATVTLREGTGQVTIQSPEVNTNIKDILYFTRILHRFVDSCISSFDDILLLLLLVLRSDQLLYPFKVLDRVNLFDIDVAYDGIGFSAQAIATRLAIAKALCSFVSSKEVEYLRLGLSKERARESGWLVCLSSISSWSTDRRCSTQGTQTARQEKCSTKIQIVCLYLSLSNCILSSSFSSRKR
jgi:ribosomal protein S9